MQIGWRAPLALVILLGTLVAVWGKGGAVALPVVWLLSALPIVRRLPLPGVSIIQDFTIQTSLYMPQALIWGRWPASWLSNCDRPSADGCCCRLPGCLSQ